MSIEGNWVTAPSIDQIFLSGMVAAAGSGESAAKQSFMAEMASRTAGASSSLPVSSTLVRRDNSAVIVSRRWLMSAGDAPN